MAIKVTFLRDADKSTAPAAQPTTLAPRAAIKTEGTDTFAFVVRGEGVERRAVRLGDADGDRVEVLAGLQPGDRVVLSPPADLKDGAKVIVK
jgi:multidrug efflux pump subunit AcrA (membrane-fusion protein)